MSWFVNDWSVYQLVAVCVRCIAFSRGWLAVCSVIWSLLTASRVGAVWALLQSVLFDDQLPARARVGIHLVIFSCLVFGFRLPVRWPGLAVFSFSLY